MENLGDIQNVLPANLPEFIPESIYWIRGFWTSRSFFYFQEMMKRRLICYNTKQPLWPMTSLY